MTGYLARRLAFALATIVAASVVSFLLVHAAGSSPGQITAGAPTTGTPTWPMNCCGRTHRPHGWR